MAKAPAADGIMSPDKMKPLLALSKREPVQAAIGMSAEGEGIILLDKKAKPKKVFSMLKASAAKSKINLNTASLRFGRAEVDTDYDSGCVRFFVNKDAPGNLRMKLVELVKRIPYQKVEINVDPSLELEPEEDEAESQQAEAAGNSGSPAPSADLAALKQRLTTLAQRIPDVLAADPSRRATVLGLAKDGQTALAANDSAAVLAAIEKLQAALDAPVTGSADGGGAKTETYDKARQAWIAMRKQLEADLEKLRQAVLEHYEDSDITAELNRSYNNKVEPVLSELDESLAEALVAATGESDPAKRADRVTEAKTIIGRYQSYVESEALFREIDANPFVPLGIAARMSKTLATLAGAI